MMRDRDVASLPATGWERVDVARIWPTELLPLLESRQDLKRSLEASMAYWIADNLHAYNRPERPWRYDDPNSSPPCLLCRGDGLVTMVDDRIQAAAEAFDPLAMAYQALTTVLFDEADLGLPDDVMAMLRDKADAIWDSFVPGREEARRWRADGSCHWMIDFELNLAKAWRPDIPWTVATSRHHSTVVAREERLIFDLVLLQDHDDPKDTADEPVLFVKGEGRAMASIRECAQINRNARARWKRKAAKQQRAMTNAV